MPLELLPLAKADAPEAARLVIESYKNNPFRRIVYPNGMGQASLDKIIEYHIKTVEDPDHYGMIVTNTNFGEIAAIAVWKHTKAMTDDDWEQETRDELKDNPDARIDLLEEFVIKGQAAKQRVKKDQRWWELLTLHTLPKYQRQGIGSMLMKWGNAKQDEMKLRGFVEATDQGFGLYVKHGYQEMERWEFDMGQWSEWGGSGMYRNVYLVREPGATTG